MKNKSIFSYCLTTILTALFFCAIPPCFAAEKYFLFPTGKSELTVSQVRIIGTVSTNKAQHKLLVTNNSGVKEYPVSANGEVFHLLIPLEQGGNKVEIYENNKAVDTLELTRIEAFIKGNTNKEIWPYYVHSKTELTENCADCHAENASSAESYKYTFQKTSCLTSQCHVGLDTGKFMHGPFKDGSCVECHNPHGTEHEKFLTVNKTELCFICHNESKNMVNEGEFVHFPVQKGECTSCHEAHVSNLEFHLKGKTIKELCARCHGAAVISHEVLHDPFESGDCNACHSAHVSEYKGLLRLQGEELCLACHEVRKEEFQSNFIHEPVKKDCNLCHAPHGSAADFHLITRKDEHGNYIKPEHPMEELCLSCHRTLDPEVTEQIEKGKVQHKPVKDGQCTICHTPHSTNYKKQLNAPLAQICFSCHPKIKETIESSLFTHGPIRTNDCAQCHQVHGSNHKELLREKFSKDFSGPFSVENFQLCFSCHNVNVVLEKISKDTGFRNGTTNLHFVHVNDSKKGRNCSACHDIHASNQEKHIRKEVPFKKKFTIKLEFTKTATGGGCIVGCHKPKDYDQIDPVKNK